VTEPPQLIRIGLRKRVTGVTLRLRWDKSPLTCAAVLRQLPVENQAWHAKYANNEIYTLTPPFADMPPMEWGCVYPAPGDLLYIPIPPGSFLPPGSPPMDVSQGLVDYGYFYERGNTLVAGPAGPVTGTIFATARSIEEVEAFAASCVDLWFRGVEGERLYLQLHGGD
jgi:Protein of unknown function (DUF3830)